MPAPASAGDDVLIVYQRRGAGLELGEFLDDRLALWSVAPDADGEDMLVDIALDLTGSR